MALTPEQERLYEEAYARGVRDPAELKRILQTATDIAPQAQTSDKPTPQVPGNITTPVDDPFLGFAPPEPNWGSDDWYDQGALLGSAIRGFEKYQ